MAERFKLDENLPRDAEVFLRHTGHDVQTVHDQGLGGRADGVIFDACRQERRILVTLDLDLADIRLYPPAGDAGIWVMRPASQSIDNTLTLLRSALAALETEMAESRLWIIEPDRIRIRE